METLHRLFLLGILLLFGAVWANAQTEIDQYGGVIPDDEFARLGNLADRLKASDATQATIKIFKDKHETIGHFLRHFYGVRDFMTRTFGVPQTKLNVVYGGEDIRRTELYLGTGDDSKKVQGVELNETLPGEQAKRTLFDEECIDCDPVVFINQFIFREGIDHLAKVLIANPDARSEIVISRVEYLSRTTRERQKLSNEIYERLEQNGLTDRSRVRLRFVNGLNARVYVIRRKLILRHKLKQHNARSSGRSN